MEFKRIYINPRNNDILTLNFKSKRQEKDFLKVLNNIYFKFNDVMQHEECFKYRIIVKLKDYNQEELDEIEKLIKSWNNKNIIFNKSHKAISIS